MSVGPYFFSRSLSKSSALLSRGLTSGSAFLVSLTPSLSTASLETGASLAAGAGLFATAVGLPFSGVAETAGVAGLGAGVGSVLAVTSGVGAALGAGAGLGPLHK